MIYHDTTAIEAVNNGKQTPDAFYHKSKLIATSKWIAQGYRGYSELTPEAGYKIIKSSWMTGDWDDAPIGHSESEIKTQLDRLELEHGNIWVIFTPTSNVFSTSFEVIVKDPEYKPDPATEPIRQRVAHKTYKLTYPNGDWAIQYHATRIVEYSAKTGKYRLNTGGWHTMTTAKRMNEYLPNGYCVNRKNWELYVTIPGTGQIKITDGMEV